MKRLLYFFAVIALLASCKGKQSESAATASQTDSTAVKAGTEYTCPMHPEVLQKEPGKCPRCGMDLEAKS